MNKLFFTMLAMLLLVSGAHAQDDQMSFPDVPADTYASDAVAELADLGIVIGFPDGTFRGNSAFTRYQAALVVTRLIDVLESEFVTQDELGSIRNSVQELASDIAALEAAIASGTGMDPEALQDLQNQLSALQSQADQNTRSIDALNDLVALLNEEIVGLGSGGDIDPSFLQDIQRNADDIANIREFVVLLRRDQVALRDRVASLEQSDAQQNERLSGLEERVTTLEDQSISFNGSLGLEYEVGRLGGADVAFDVDRIFGIGQEREVVASVFSSGTNDENDDGDEGDDGEEAQDRQDIEQETGDISPTFEISFGFASERGVSGVFNDFEASVTLELVEATVLDGDEIAPDDVDNINDDGIAEISDPDNYITGYVFSFDEIGTTFTPIGAEPLIFTYGEEPDANFTPYIFESLGPGFVARLGTPDVLAFLQPELVVAYGTYQQGGDDDDETIELPNNEADFVYDPTPTGEDEPDAGTLAPGGPNAGGVLANPFTDAYYRAIRGTLSPFEGVSGGFSVAQLSGNAADYQDEEGDNANVTVLGLDGEVNLSIFTVTAEFATNQIGDNVYFQNEDSEVEDVNVNDGAVVAPDAEGDEQDVPVILEPGTVDDSTLYVAQVEVDAEDIPLLDTLSANYRSIPQYWYGLKYDDDDYTFGLDQTGFGAEAGIGIFIFNLDAYADYYTIAEEATETAEDGGADVTGDEVFVYGVDVGVEVYRAIEPFGFFSQTLLNGTAIESADDVERDDSGYISGFGVGLRHDGEAEDALLSGLNFEVRYDLSEGDLAGSGLDATADTEVTFAGFTVNPYLEYSADSSAGALSDDTQTFAIGTGLSSEPLDIFLQPSLAANVNYRNTSHTDVGGDEDNDPNTGEDTEIDDYTTNVLQFSVGLTLNQFLFQNSQFGVRYGYYQGENVSVDLDPPGPDDDTATNISEGDQSNDLTQTTQGVEVAWTYYGLEFGYGLYSNDNGTNTTDGQTFTVAYELEF